MAVERWDGLIVARDHPGCFEHRHPLDMPQRLPPEPRPILFVSSEPEEEEIDFVATFTFFHEFKNNLANGTIDLDSDSFKWALSNTAPTAASDTVFTDITEIAAGNGYTAGGQAADSVTWTETAAGTGTWRFSCADEVFTASGGSIGPFQYIILYDDTPTTPADPLVGFLDFGSAVTVTDGNTFTIDVGASGIFELS